MSTWNEDDYTEHTLTRETPHGVFRARVSLDEYPEPPEDYSGDPIIDTEGGRLVYGGARPSGEGVDPTVARVLEAFELTRPGRYAWCGEWDVETWERYVRAFHGGTVAWITDYHTGGRAYVAVALPAFRRAHGWTDLLRPPATDEWRAFVDGEVYVVTIEKACAFDDDGEPIEWTELDGPVGGCYGERWAKEEAAEQLTWWIDHTAAGMLPLGATA